jgi:glutathione S-transferase
MAANIFENRHVMARMRLYHSPGACSLAVHIALEEIGCEYEPAMLRVNQQENKRPEYLAVNPRGRVPALVIEDDKGERVLTEVLAILTYLAGQFPEKGLLPLEGEAFARSLEWMSWLGSAVHQTGARTIIRPSGFVDDEACQEKMREAGRLRVRASYEDMNARLAGRQWAVADQYSFVDSLLVVYYRWGLKVGMDVRNDFPEFTRVIDKALARPAVRRAIDQEGIAAEFGIEEGVT